jgi:hypothetical protein
VLESIITPVLHLGALTVGAGPLWKFNRGSRREPRVGSAPISVTDGTADHFAVALKNDRQAASLGMSAVDVMPEPTRSPGPRLGLAFVVKVLHGAKNRIAGVACDEFFSGAATIALDQAALHRVREEWYPAAWRECGKGGVDRAASFLPEATCESGLCQVRRGSHHDETREVVRWYGKATNVEHRNRAESLRAAEKRMLELIANGIKLSEVLDEEAPLAKRRPSRSSPSTTAITRSCGAAAFAKNNGYCRGHFPKIRNGPTKFEIWR